MKLILTLILALAILGCETKSVTAPTTETVVQSGSRLARFTDPDGSSFNAWVMNDKSSPSGVRILYYCDFPMTMVGPPAPGHCYTDGSGCTGDPVADNRTGICSSGDPEISNESRQIGDPTADDAGDPDIGNDISNADADGIVVR